MVQMGKLYLLRSPVASGQPLAHILPPARLAGCEGAVALLSRSSAQKFPRSGEVAVGQNPESPWCTK